MSAVVALSPFSASTQLVAAQQPASQNVKVVNTSREPVPTTVVSPVQVNPVRGSSIGIDPENNTVCIDPACNLVGIDPANNGVTIQNSVENPIIVHDPDDPAKHWVAYHTVLTGTDQDVDGFLAVPAGTRLVVEHISYYIYGGDGRSHFELHTSSGPNAAILPHYFTIHPNPLGSWGDMVNIQTRIYSDAPGVKVIFHANGTSTVKFTVDGYLVDL